MNKFSLNLHYMLPSSLSLPHFRTRLLLVTLLAGIFLFIPFAAVVLAAILVGEAANCSRFGHRLLGRAGRWPCCGFRRRLWCRFRGRIWRARFGSRYGRRLWCRYKRWFSCWFQSRLWCRFSRWFRSRLWRW